MRPHLIELLARFGVPQLSGLVPTPGFAYAVMLLAVTWLFLVRAGHLGISRNRALEVALAAGLGAGVGTRLFYLLATGDLFQTSPASWLDGSSGTASWGAYLGAVFGMALYCRLAEVKVWLFLDLAGSAAGLGIVLGRWSCFLAGDDFGRVTAVPWGIRFPAGSLPFQVHLARGLVPAEAPASLPVHPLQFYLMGAGLVDFLVASWVWRRHSSRPGVTLAAFFASHATTRFGLEFWRDPAAGGARGLLSTSQWMCLGLGAAAAAILITQSRAAGGPARPTPVLT